MCVQNIYFLDTQQWSCLSSLYHLSSTETNHFIKRDIYLPLNFEKLPVCFCGQYFNLPYLQHCQTSPSFSSLQKNKQKSNSNTYLVSHPNRIWENEIWYKFCFSETVTFERLHYFSKNIVKNSVVIEGQQTISRKSKSRESG